MTKSKMPRSSPGVSIGGTPGKLVRLYYSGFGPLRQGIIQLFWLEQLDP
jgi:hypothetical protein